MVKSMISLNEFTPYVCGMKVDQSMYTHSYMYANVTQQITNAPIDTIVDATYSIYPPLPSTLSISESTGVISGSTEDLAKFNVFSVIRTVNTVSTKFILVIETGKEHVNVIIDRES